MRETLTSSPELFSDISWNLLLLGEETAKKWDHSEFNIEHIIHTLFTSSEFFAFIEKLSIDQDTVLDITEDFLEETPINDSDIFTIGEDLEILLDNANQIKIQWGSRLIEIPHLLIALGRDLRIGNYVFQEGNLSIEKLEEELKFSPNINQSKNPVDFKNVIEINNQSNFESNQGTLVNKKNLDKAIVPLPKSELQVETKKQIGKDDNALSLYGKDLTESAKKALLDPVIGRENEINNLMRVLCRRNKNNPILIGNPGVGKTSIAKLLAQLIIEKKVPDSLKDFKIISLDLGALVAGTKFRGQLEERLSLILQELNDPSQGMILFIDEIHSILSSDRSTADISNILRPLLAEGELRCIGTTTPEKFRETIEKDQALNNCFQKIAVNEPSVELSAQILQGIKKKYELHHGIRISEDAVNYSAKLADRYISDKYLPDKAIDLIDEAAAQLKIESNNKPQLILQQENKIYTIDKKLNNLLSKNIEEKEKLLNVRQQSEAKLNVLFDNWNFFREEMEQLSILMKEEDKLTKKIKDRSNRLIANDLEFLEKLEEDLSEIENEIQKVEENFNKIKKNRNFPFRYQVEPDDIADVISKITGIPISKVVSSERMKLVNLEKELSEKVIGQEKAIEAVSSAIRRARVGMKSPKRPIGSFLFMGPTGVGKTELAKSLASALFDEEEALLRLDMSEYMEKNAVARLLGAPPGYVGYEEGGQLTEAVRRKPYSVILLDEIEKAHTEVFNILLQVLDEGRLTDSQGRTVDFKNTVIIMTSNLAGKVILEYSQKISKSEEKLEKDQQTLENSISNTLSSIFRPEFLNRIDEVVKFNPLSIDELQKIIILQTEDLKNLLLEQKINIAIDKKVINKIANDSYEPEYGARPLGRELRRQIENPLAAKLLEDNFKNKKNITIKLNPAKKDEIVFRPS
ncbi:MULTISPECIES: ATP-dependent Clp protease ATP-binding subunit [Prochlorococcus]|uniref:Putative ATP-dependent Clp protease ATP-binding subunit ClpB n=1 Tax=Prochlorococcus marinus str. MIT 9116 TaxID=167544 RepID=A0A0A1ZP40_PROMR|nr:AAA family ATPase [Prochlorococcus marinus]KGF89202.1 putative ATP-dependent Clp protease ATP-binding subunit ClpB [Prochlorococcus marinus str. MIT 9107]KGF89958.1 putative ATP-dependent Clp protease ATP-binding subunit ClpB [Prochlorococcus marinus str. MIT 9116]KGF95393.1 putative ATP-dependent Clp protease ATP-binding subunit ClpB [Prochlorococcus marinus str. MIT 9123]